MDDIKVTVAVSGNSPADVAEKLRKVCEQIAANCIPVDGDPDVTIQHGGGGGP